MGAKWEVGPDSEIMNEVLAGTVQRVQKLVNYTATSWSRVEEGEEKRNKLSKKRGINEESEKKCKQRERELKYKVLSVNKEDKKMMCKQRKGELKYKVLSENKEDKKIELWNKRWKEIRGRTLLELGLSSKINLDESNSIYYGSRTYFCGSTSLTRVLAPKDK